MAEKAIGFHLEFKNKSSKWIQLLDSEHHISFPRLKPGASKTFDVLKIRKKNRKYRIESWKIREVLIDDIPFGINLETKDLLGHVIVNFQVDSDEDGRVVSFLVTGVPEVKNSDAFLRMGLGIGTVLGRNRIWEKRGTVKIYEVDFRHEEPPYQQPIIETQVVEVSNAPERAATSLYKRKRVIKPMIKRNQMALKNRVNSSKSRRNSSNADLSSPMQHMNPSSQYCFPLRDKFQLYFLSLFLLVLSLYGFLLLL